MAKTSLRDYARTIEPKTTRDVRIPHGAAARQAAFYQAAVPAPTPADQARTVLAAFDARVAANDWPDTSEQRMARILRELLGELDEAREDLDRATRVDYPFEM